MWKIKDFEKQREVVLKHFKRVGFSKEKVADFCTMAGIPLIVVYEFLASEYTEHEAVCRKKIKEIEKFYGIFEE